MKNEDYYLDLFVVGSFITIASFNSPYFPKYSFNVSENNIENELNDLYEWAIRPLRRSAVREAYFRSPASLTQGDSPIENV